MYNPIRSVIGSEARQSLHRVRKARLKAKVKLQAGLSNLNVKIE